MRNSKMLLVLVLALSMSGLFVASSHAAFFYVDTNHSDASDSNPGTEVEPWKTIQKAADTMTEGDTTIIKGGTYTANTWAVVKPINSGAPGNFITYKGYPGHDVIINGNDTNTVGIFIDEVSYLRFEHLTITGSQLTGIHVVARETHVSNIMIDDVIVQNNGKNGITFWGPEDHRITDCIVKNSHITNNKEKGINLLNNCDNFVIHNNEVSHSG